MKFSKGDRACIVCQSSSFATVFANTSWGFVDSGGSISNGTYITVGACIHSAIDPEGWFVLIETGHVVGKAWVRVDDLFTPTEAFLSGLSFMD